MDFHEYCAMTGADVSDDAVDFYLRDGGFPQFLRDGLTEYLQQLVSDILYRDIVKRHNVRNIAVLEELVRFLFSNISKGAESNPRRHQKEPNPTQSRI